MYVPPRGRHISANAPGVLETKGLSPGRKAPKAESQCRLGPERAGMCYALAVSPPPSPPISAKCKHLFKKLLALIVVKKTVWVQVKAELPAGLRSQRRELSPSSSGPPPWDVAAAAWQCYFGSRSPVLEANFSLPP